MNDMFIFIPLMLFILKTAKLRQKKGANYMINTKIQQMVGVLDILWMMIFILGEGKDITTDIVCHWLNYYQSPFIRINKEETSLYELLLLLDHTEQDVFKKKDKT